MKAPSVAALPVGILRALILIALVGVAILILRVTYPPFQDYPNNLHVLTLDRAIEVPEVARYFQRPQHFVYGYSLCSLLNRASSGWISEATALRWMLVFAALGVPLGLARVARAVGVHPLWTALLALPLALSWPLKMGFVQFSLALVAALFGMAAAIRATRDPTLSRGFELALWCVLTYMAHALALVMVMIGMGLAWIDAKGSRPALVAFLGLALLPAGILLTVDLTHDVFSAIPETTVSLEQHTTSFRSLGAAMAHVATRSYGVTDANALLWYAPLLVVLGVATAVAFRHHRELRRGDTSFLLWAVPFMIVACIGSPEATERIYFIGSRLAVMAMGLVTVMAAVTVARATLSAQVITVGVTVLALIGVFGETISRSGSLLEILGSEGPERVSGRYLTAKVGPCADPSERYWGRYESARHLWAYALNLDGITPYLFAWSRYHPVQYRGEIYDRQLHAPQESINGDRLIRGSCKGANEDRLRGATSWVGFDGALITGQPEILSDLAGHPGLEGARHLSPGLLLAQPPSGPTAELRVVMDHFGSAQNLVRGWSDSERTGDRNVRWSDGPFSEVAFELVPEPGSYELSLTMFPFPEAMPQSVGVTLNEEPLGQLIPSEGWNRLSLLVPSRRLHKGPNVLTLTYQRVARPSEVNGSADDRDLAVMFDAIDLVPLPSRLSIEMDAGDGGRKFLHGWSGLEIIEDRAVRWNEGPDSGLGFEIQPAPGEYRLTLTVRPYEPTVPQTLAVSLNDTALGSLAIDEGWREYALTVPADLLRIEENVLSFEYGNVLRPADISESTDTRRLAVLFDAVRLSPDDDR